MRETASVEVITPEVARDLLARSHNVRSTQAARVADYAKQMRAGKWRLHGDSIDISVDGTLLNGFHRLSAVILYGQPVTFSVLRGVDPRAVFVRDTGNMRRLRNLCASMGLKNSSTCAGAAVAAHWFERHDRVTAPGGHERLRYGQEGQDWLAAHRGLEGYVAAVHEWAAGGQGCDHKAALAAMYYHLRAVPEAPSFFEPAASGLGLRSEGRDKVIVAYRREVRGLRNSLVVPVLGMAWNAWLRGRSQRWLYPTPTDEQLTFARPKGIAALCPACGTRPATTGEEG